MIVRRRVAENDFGIPNGSSGAFNNSYLSYFAGESARCATGNNYALIKFVGSLSKILLGFGNPVGGFKESCGGPLVIKDRYIGIYILK